MAVLPPQPIVTLPLVDSDRTPANYWQDYLIAVDRLLRGLGAGTIGPLVNAASDAAAQAAGVKIGGLYQSGGTVKIRLV